MHIRQPQIFYIAKFNAYFDNHHTTMEAKVEIKPFSWYVDLRFIL